MVRIFISYSRVDIEFVEKKLYPHLARRYRHENVWYDDEIHGGADWWQTILDNIAHADIFLYVLSNESVTSDYCQAEFHEAQRLQKVIITVQARDRTKLGETLSAIQYIDMNPNVDQADAIVRLFTAIGHQNLRAIRKRKPLFSTVTAKPRMPDDTLSTPREDVITPTLTGIPKFTPQKNSNIKPSFVIAGVVIALLLLIGFLNLSGLFSGTSSNPTPVTEVAQLQNNATPLATPSPTNTDIPTATPNATQVEMTIRAEMLEIVNEEQATQDALSTLDAEANAQAEQGTVQALTATANAWTPVPTIDVRATAEARSTNNAQSTQDSLYITGTAEAQSTVNAQATQDSSTMTATAYVGATANIRMTQNRLSVTTTAEARSTNNSQSALDAQSTQDSISMASTAYAPIELALDSVNENNEWLPYHQQFDLVYMSLVPAGCFRMGNADGGDNEQPVHTRCLENPYWIDQFEVSNGQFDNRIGQAEEDSYWIFTTLPREKITWQEARDFCELRGARLPTELEWEYAARGVDGLTYPWGNTFILNRTNFAETSDNETTFITDIANGVSWVGAYHMLGNVSEWTSTQFSSYPYNYSDGREDMDVGGNRVVRGGSYNTTRDYLRSTMRFLYPPSTSSRTIGFRCARDFSLSDIQG